MSIFTIDKFCSKDIPSRADYNEIGLELTYSRSGSEDYYFNSNSDTLLAALVGSGSHKLNLGSMPKPGDYQALMSGINPRTDEVFCSKTRQTQLQTDNHALAGFSTSFNVEKSLSLLYATLPRDQQIKFEQAMMEAASRTISTSKKVATLHTEQVRKEARRILVRSLLRHTSTSQIATKNRIFTSTPKFPT